MERRNEQFPGQHQQLQQQLQQSQQSQQLQQPQQQQAAVVIVQQPIVVGPGTFVRGQPFIRRGVKLNNGTKIGGSCITCLGIFGASFIFMGLIFLIVGISVFVGIMFLLIGGGMLAACFKFCHKAKKDYDALPQDHPDRVIYSTPVLRPHRGGGPVSTAAYQFPPGTRIITSNTVQGGGQLPQGAHFIIDPSSIQSGGLNARGSVYMPSMSITPPVHVPPAEDKPPSYEEVCKDGRV